jgi:5-dehydro-2-deoxygluconokinase
MLKHEKLYVLPFDHRGSFFKMFGLREDGLTTADREMLRDYKHLIYEAFLYALSMGVPKQAAAILVDEEFGDHIHAEAQRAGIRRILTVEKSGRDELEFEYGEEFGAHIEALKPDYAKALLRFNPDGNKESNERQIKALKRLNDFCKQEGFGFLVEPLASATDKQLAQYGEDVYEKEKRWETMVKSLQEFHNAGIEADVWKLEGLSDFNQMRSVVQEAQRGGRDAGVVVLGRGESEEKVKEWLSVAAKIEGVIGFAVGRTVFKEDLVKLHNKQQSAQDAILSIAKKYKKFVDLFENSRAKKF